LVVGDGKRKVQMQAELGRRNSSEELLLAVAVSLFN
jgi:hypothetical protein